MMLAGLPVPDDAIDGLAEFVRASGADELADRLEPATADQVHLLALTIDERAIILAALEDPPEGTRNPRLERRPMGAGREASRGAWC
jgi:hypothetical protein